MDRPATLCYPSGLNNEEVLDLPYDQIQQDSNPEKKQLVMRFQLKSKLIEGEREGRRKQTRPVVGQ